ncbi:MAG: L,D-transpeptidase [Clostridiales bacterium]|nr:L,D-transpeptidase [Clostridiales bacterium]
MKKTALILTLIFTFFINIQVFCGEENYYIAVNRATNCVTVYDENNTPVKAMVCSVGANDATPLGTFSTTQKLRWHFLLGDEYGQYCTRIVDDILFHSVPYLAQSEDALNTENYNMLGQADSLGCVRLAVIDAKWIYDNCPIGTAVTIFDGTEADDPLGKPEAIKLGANAPYPTWDPTDPSENNPYNSLGAEITAEKTVRSIYQNKYQSKEQLLSYLRTGVSACDTAGNGIDFIIETEADPAVGGAYDVVYKAEDALGRTDTLTARFIILPSELIASSSVNSYTPKKPEGLAENSFYGSPDISIIAAKSIRVVYQNSAQNNDWLLEYLRYGVNAYDADGNEMDFTVEADINQAKCGTYEAVYKAEDSLGHTARLKTQVWVLPSELVSNISAALYPTWADSNRENSPAVNITSEKYVRTIYQNSHQSRDWLSEYLRYGVNAYDSGGNGLDFTVITRADPAESGVYDVIYRATDSTGRTSRLKTKFIVLPSELISKASLRSD